MKKIALIIFLVLMGFRSDILYSAPDRNIHGQASDESEEIKGKIATLEEAISFLEKEIGRDRDIASWGQNQIALGMTRDLLKRDFSEKKRFLDNIKGIFGVELKADIEFIEQNLENEKEIVFGILIDINTIKYTQAYIQKNITKKNDLLKILKDKLKEIKIN